MSIGDETLRISDEVRVWISGETDAATRALVSAWARTWTDLQAEFTAAANELLTLVEDGQWPTAYQVARSARAKAALAQARTRLGELAKAAGVDLIDRSGRIIDGTTTWQDKLVWSQLPPGAGAVLGALGVLNADALDAMVARSTQQITSLLGAIPDDVYDALRRALVRGVAVGENPRATVRALLRSLNGEWTAGLARALTIARTEMLDANRAASHALDQARADVMAGWRWQCSLSKRTCPGCLSLNGSMHEVEETGPDGHQNCRCQRIPVAKTWKELGLGDLGLVEPPEVFRDARGWFDDLPEADQLDIMGPGRLAAYRNGVIGWDDMVALRHTPGWRDSYGVATLADSLARAAA